MGVNTLSTLMKPIVFTEREKEIQNCLVKLRDTDSIHIGERMPSIMSVFASTDMVVTKTTSRVGRTKLRVYRWELIKNRFGEDGFILTRRELELIQAYAEKLEEALFP